MRTSRDFSDMLSCLLSPVSLDFIVVKGERIIYVMDVKMSYMCWRDGVFDLCRRRAGEAGAVSNCPPFWEIHMKVIKVSDFGLPDVLLISNADDPQPANASAVVQIEAIGLGFMDTAARRGESYLASTPGFVPGYEVAGTVRSIGSGTEEHWLGRRVFSILRNGGGCAERVAVPTAELLPLPDQVSAQTAVATGLNALVAQVGVGRVPFADHDRVLVRGAGGGIGLMCVQFAAMRCDAITATSSSEVRGKTLIGLGASSIWHRTSGNPLVPASFDVIIDTVVGDEWPSYFDRLNPNGRYMMCGGIGGMPPSDFGMKILEHFHKSPTLYAFSLNSIPLADIDREATILWEHVQAGRILPVVDSVLPLSEIVAAHRKLDAGEVFGKIILVPD